jgi:hypothetical protein
MRKLKTPTVPNRNRRHGRGPPLQVGNCWDHALGHQLQRTGVADVGESRDVCRWTNCLRRVGALTRR